VILAVFLFRQLAIRYKSLGELMCVHRWQKDVGNPNDSADPSAIMLLPMYASRYLPFQLTLMANSANAISTQCR
jgi:hypothetical protein